MQERPRDLDRFAMARRLLTPVAMPRLAGLVVALALAALASACSDDGGAAGLCAGRPCLTSIDDAADWAAVSAPHAHDRRCDFADDAKFIAPATATAELQEVVFQDVKAHRLHLDFMTQALPELFGGMTQQQYQQVVLRRAGRQYWAGALFRLVDFGGATIGYGFDVAVDPAWDEQLTEAEVTAVAALPQASSGLESHTSTITRFERKSVVAPAGVIELVVGSQRPIYFSH